MKVLRYLKGTNWRAATVSLQLSMYWCFIRPILKYEMEAYFSVSEHAIGLLQKIQNLWLRLCTGTMKNTPILCLQNHCNKMPLKLKYKYLRLKYKINIVSIGDHLARSIYRTPGRKDFLQTLILKRLTC